MNHDRACDYFWILFLLGVQAGERHLSLLKGCWRMHPSVGCIFDSPKPTYKYPAQLRQPPCSRSRHQCIGVRSYASKDGSICATPPLRVKYISREITSDLHEQIEIHTTAHWGDADKYEENSKLQPQMKLVQQFGGAQSLANSYTTLQHDAVFSWDLLLLEHGCHLSISNLRYCIHHAIWRITMSPSCRVPKHGQQLTEATEPDTPSLKTRLPRSPNRRRQDTAVQSWPSLSIFCCKVCGFAMWGRRLVLEKLGP